MKRSEQIKSEFKASSLQDLAWFSARRWRDARRELDRRLEPVATAPAALPAPDGADLLEKSQQLIKLIKVTALAVRDNASTDGFPPPGRNAHYARSILEAADQLEESLIPLLRGVPSRGRPAAPATVPTTVG